jgi:hypothetical protein
LDAGSVSISMQKLGCLEDSLLIVSGSSKMLWGFGNAFLIYVSIVVV